MKISKKLIVIVSAVVAVIIAAIVAIVLIGKEDTKKEEETQPVQSGGYKDCVINFAKAVEESDAELMAKAYSPIVERNDNYEFDYVMREIALMQHQYFLRDYGENFKIEVQFEPESELDDEELEYYRENAKSRGYDGEITEGIVANSIFKITSNEGERTVYAFFAIVKYDGEWGIVDGDFDE